MGIFAEGMVRGGLSRSLLAIAVTTALAGGMTACGGGGGNVRRDNPASPSPPPPPPPPPLVEPAMDAHLALINATEAQRDGYTGEGYRIGVIDTGVNRNHPALAGRVAANLVYVSRSENDMSVGDKVGHGTTVAQLAAGTPFGRWPGGVAPGATVLSARIISDEEPEDDGSGQGNEVTGAIGLKAIHQDLADRGMRIMNNSWGGLYWTRPSATAPIADEYRFFIRDHDGLVVFATGNEGRRDPTDMAALPSQPGPDGTFPAADLERGWLAVAALDTSAPTKLMYYSNACGVAKSYCLVAPGTVTFTGHDDTAGKPSYYYGTGTSFAAPLVSGAAAVVWQKFPYFDNDLVRQTLLGTATDLGAPGADAVFGYGLLNLEKALRGPAKLDWGDVHVQLPKGASEPWWNGISGEGGLVVDGGGEVVDNVDDPSLSISGESTFEGGLRITGGATVSVNGSVASDITVDPGSYLYAWEVTLHGDVVNNGVMQINSPEFVNVDSVFKGTIRNNGVFFNRDFPHTTLEGDFVQGADGEFWTYLGSDPLRIAGTATLDGGLFVYDVIPGYVAHARTEVLVADGGVSGEFAWQGYNDERILLEATVGYGSDRVWLDVARVDVVAAATATMARIEPAALASAIRVEDAFDRMDGRLQAGKATGVVIADEAIAAAGRIQQVSTASAFQTTLESLAGRAHSAAAAMTFDSIDLNRRALATRFGDLVDGRQAEGAWSQALGGGGHGGFAGGGFALDGWMLGTERRWGAAGVVGLAFGESRVEAAQFGGRETGRDRQTQGEFYAGWVRGNAYALGQVGIGAFDRRIDRRLLLGTAWDGAHADYAGDFTATSIEFGYRIGDGDGDGNLTAYAGADHARVESDGFRETGGSGFGLRADRMASARTQVLAGLRATHDWARLGIKGYVEWQHALTAQGLETAAGFVGVDAWSPLTGLQPAESGGFAGFAVSSRLSPRASLSLGYDQAFGPRGDASAVSLRYAAGF